VKALLPSSDTGRFDLRIDGNPPNSGSINVGDGGTTGFVPVRGGVAHTVSEAGNNTNLANYAVTIGGACAADGSITPVSGNSYTCTITNTRKILQVKIDLKPGASPNCVSPKSMGTVPVAIFGNSTFNVANINQSTLKFGGASPVRCVIEDALMEGPVSVFRTDGILDLVCQFDTQQVAWPAAGSNCGTVQLIGNLSDGTPIHGSDDACRADESTCSASKKNVIRLQPGPVDGKDTSVSRGSPESETELYANLNNGAGGEICVGQTGGRSRIPSKGQDRVLIQFPLPSLGAGVSVVSARLGLTAVIAQPSSIIEMYRLKQSWVEGTRKASPLSLGADGATWQTYNGIYPWPGISGFRSLDGGGYSLASAEINDPIGTGLLDNSSIGALSWINLDPKKVQQWFDGSFANDGILIRSLDELIGNTEQCIASSDNGTTSWRPILEITTSTQ